MKSVITTVGIFYAMIAMAIIGCTSNPVTEAQTLEQKGYASYGVYVIYQGKAAALYKEPTTPDRVKRVLQQADALAYPVSLTLLEALDLVGDLRALVTQCEAGPPPPDLVEACKTANPRLTLAAQNLSRIYFEAKPRLEGLKTAYQVAAPKTGDLK